MRELYLSGQVCNGEIKARKGVQDRCEKSVFSPLTSQMLKSSFPPCIPEIMEAALDENPLF